MSFDDAWGNSRSGGGRGPSVASTGGGLDTDSNYKITMANIRQMTSNVAQIKNMTDRLGTNKDSADMREKLRSLIEATKTTAKDTANTIKYIEVDSGSPEERGKKRAQQQKLFKDFQTVLKQFQDISKVSAEKERAYPTPPAPKPSKFEPEDQEQEEKQSLLKAQRAQQYALENESTFNEALINDREQGIKDIEKAVLEVNEIFRDLSTLVVEQGSMINSIEANVEASAAETTKATSEIKKASEYQKSARGKMCCLALILMIIIAVIVVVIYFFFRK